MLSALLIVLPFAADLLHSTSPAPSDKGAVVASAKAGAPRWSADWTMEPAERDGKKVLRFTEQGRGNVTPFSGEVRWSLESIWSLEPGLQPLSSEKTITNNTGAIVGSERKYFDLRNGTLRFERQSPGKRAEVKTLSIPSDTLSVEGIAGVLRFLPFDRLTSFPAHVVSNEPRLYTVTFELRGKERVQTPVGEFESYKVEMVPHVGVLNVFRSLLPKTFFWFTTAPPHFWVQYQGLENGAGTPEIIMRLDRGGR